MKKHVVDWLISNHDGHSGQFLRTEHGSIYGIDKTQSFRYFGKDSLDWNYHPNSKYGEEEPIYNKLAKAVRDGKVKIDPMAALQEIKAVEAIPDAVYAEALHPYAVERAAMLGQNVEGIQKFTA